MKDRSVPDSEGNKSSIVQAPALLFTGARPIVRDHMAAAPLDEKPMAIPMIRQFLDARPPVRTIAEDILAGMCDCLFDCWWSTPSTACERSASRQSNG